MQPYKNLNFFSSVMAFDYGKDWILIELTSGEIRIYTHNDSGKKNVELMKKYARKGKGLASFIDSHIINFKTKIWQE